MNLTQAQLQAIDRHLRKENWLLNEALIAELVDHYVTGICERTASGMPFEAALQEVHVNFGGRKGLLKMEEEFAAGESKRAGRMFWRAVLSHFQLPKLIYTLIITAIVSTLKAAGMIANHTQEYIYIGFTLHFILVVTASIRNQRHRLNKHNIWPIIQGFNLVLWLLIWPRLFIPDAYRAELESLLSVLVILAALLFEFSLIAYMKSLPSRKRIVA